LLVVFASLQIKANQGFDAFVEELDLGLLLGRPLLFVNLLGLLLILGPRRDNDSVARAHKVLSELELCSLDHHFLDRQHK
jgi:hypothetical protein